VAREGSLQPVKANTGDEKDVALFALMASTMRPHWRPLVLAIVLLLATAALNALPPYLLQLAIDGPIAQRNAAALWPLAGWYGLSALAMFGLNYACGRACLIICCIRARISLASIRPAIW